MSYDYGKDKNKKKPVKKNQKTSNRPSIPGWLMFLSGVAFTVFAQFLFHLTQVDTSTITTNPGDSLAGTPEENHKKPTINFYNQLKTMEVKVPGDEAKAPAIVPVTGQPVSGQSVSDPSASKKPATETAPQAAAAGKPAEAKAEKPAVVTPQQFLQAGSFKTREDADQHRAELLLLGVKANIETKNNADGSALYRVIIGPFSSASDLSKARTTLLNNDIPTMTIKR